MAETDHPNGTCGMFCPYCRADVDRTLDAVRSHNKVVGRVIDGDTLLGVPDFDEDFQAEHGQGPPA